jgi:hypothetical protein
VQYVGIGKLGGQGTARDIARQGGEGAVLGVGRQVGLREVGVERSRQLGAGRSELPQQALARTDHLGEQIFLRFEVRIEGAAGQPRRQHDVVDVGAGVAA